MLGDAAHPMTPFLGQGACVAIEDAMVRGRAFADFPGTPFSHDSDGSADSTRSANIRVERITQSSNVAVGSISTDRRSPRYVGFTPDSRNHSGRAKSTLWANYGSEASSPGDCCMPRRSVAERKNALLTGALGHRS